MTNMKKTILLVIIPIVVIVFYFFISDLRSIVYEYYSNTQDSGANLTHFRLFNIVVIFLVITLFTFFGFILAKKKGRNKILWMILSFLFNFWAVLVLWFLPDVKNKKIWKKEAL
jgi:hypothetical protein